MRLPRTLLIATMALGLAVPVAAATQNSEVLRARMQHLKAVQQRMMLQEPMHGRQERKERFEEAKKEFKRRPAVAKKTGKAGTRMREIEGERLEQLQNATPGERARQASLPTGQSTASALRANPAAE